MAEFEWKSIDEIEEEKQLEEMQAEVNREKEIQRLALDEFLIKQAEEYVLSSNVSEEEKTRWKAVFEPFEVGVHYQVGKKVRYKEIVYEVIQEHTTQADWLPPDVPALYKVFLQDETEDGEDVVHEWKQPTGAHDAYSIGSIVFHNGIVWQSTADGNVWEPGIYGWQKIEE